ncbi:hypothetical protein DKX38_003000 [Salix brachista]|uniref:Uncharacterized protein n=1 Tax=Salix brachista TaxID=2182728 RepID=A0A5N5NQ81_9ROSI|nr:hypothetical protein DKX38_003000 [Salix brachista]
MKIVLLLLGSWKRIFILFLLALFMHIFILKQEQAGPLQASKVHVSCSCCVLHILAILLPVIEKRNDRFLWDTIYAAQNGARSHRSFYSALSGAFGMALLAVDKVLTFRHNHNQKFDHCHGMEGSRFSFGTTHQGKQQMLPWRLQGTMLTFLSPAHVVERKKSRSGDTKSKADTPLQGPTSPSSDKVPTYKSFSL